MKFGIFTDPHCATVYNIGCRFPARSFARVAEAVDFFKKEKVDGIICLGDLVNIHGSVDESKSVLNVVTNILANANVPLYFCYGNHDCEIFSKKYFRDHCKGTSCPSYVDFLSFRMIFLDACYHDDGSTYKPGHMFWDNSYLPNSEIKRLKELLNTDKNCYLFLHQNLDEVPFTQCCIRNREKVRSILSTSGNVKGVWQGHDHEGHDSVIDGVQYHTLKGMCEGDTNSFYVIDLV